MRKIVLKLKKFLSFLLSFFPTTLPTGMAEFTAFCDSIIWTYDLPDLVSYRHAIASMVMHLGPTTISKPKRYFAISVKKAMANQIAYENIQLFKEKKEATTTESHVEPISV
jgi:hypothetical protein